MLLPSGNGLYLLPMTHYFAGLSLHPIDSRSRRFVALAAKRDPAMWHSRLGHLNMHSIHA
jgi:hypothetical protein